MLAVVYDRARSVQWDVQVKLHAGNSRQVAKRQLAMMDRQAGAISLQTYQEEAGRNSRMEDQRMTEELQKQARMQAAVGFTPGAEESGEATSKGSQSAA